MPLGRLVKEKGGTDDWDRAAQEAGVPTPNGVVDTSTTHWLWKILWFPLWFRDLRAGLYVMGGLVGTLLIWYWAGWQSLLMGPVAAGFAWYWWKTHFHIETVMVIEVRAEGQRFRPPHLPMPYKVRDSAFRIFFVPRQLYDRARKYGTYSPIFEMPSNVVICDYCIPERNIIIFNEDVEWSNFAIVAQMNDGMARNLKRRSQKEDWLVMMEREAVMLYKAGDPRMPKERLDAILSDVEQQLDIVRESPYTRRAFAIYYQDTIPRLKRQVIELLKGIEELSFALAAELAYSLYNQPMSPEIEQEISYVKTKYGKLKVRLFEDFDLNPEVYEHMAETEFDTPKLHELAQEAAGASPRPHNLPPSPSPQRIV